MADPWSEVGVGNPEHGPRPRRFARREPGELEDPRRAGLAGDPSHPEELRLGSGAPAMELEPSLVQLPHRHPRRTVVLERRLLRPVGPNDNEPGPGAARWKGDAPDDAREVAHELAVLAERPEPVVEGAQLRIRRLVPRIGHS